MKQLIILLAFTTFALPALSAPYPHPAEPQVAPLPAALNEKRQDQTVTFPRDPGSETGIPSITDSYLPTITDSILPTITDSTSIIPVTSDSSILSATFTSTLPGSISSIPSSSSDGGTTINNGGTVTYVPGGTRTVTFWDQTVTLTFPPIPITIGLGISRTTETPLPASTYWNNGGPPALSLTFPAGAVRTPEARVAGGEGRVDVVEVIKRQVDTISWVGTLPGTTYWGDRTITIGGETITFGDGPGGPAMSLTIDAGPEYTPEAVKERMVGN